MKKVITAIAMTLATLMLIYFVASWIDIVADNDSQNPKHHKYNLFVVAAEMAHEKYEVAAEVTEYNADTNCAVLVDTNGEAWVYEGELAEGQQVTIKFDDNGTKDIYDDEIIEIRG